MVLASTMVNLLGPSVATIPNVVATHLIGERQLQIARGQLTLQPTPYTQQKEAKAALPARRPSKAHELPTHVAEAEDDHTKPVLLLTVGTASWPLYPTTLFGTHDKDEKVYTFLAEMSLPEDLEDAPPATQQSPTATWVKLTLSPAVCAYKSPVQTGRDKMEKLLIKHGLLKDGLAAAVDEVEQAAKQALPASFTNSVHQHKSGAHPAAASHTAAETLSEMAASAGAVLTRALSWGRRPSHEGGEEKPKSATTSPSGGRRLSFGRSKSPNGRAKEAAESLPTASSLGQAAQDLDHAAPANALGFNPTFGAPGTTATTQEQGPKGEQLA